MTLAELREYVRGIGQAVLNKAKTYTDTAVAGLVGISFEVVQTLPTQNIKTNVIYLVPNSAQAQDNVYDEWIYVNSNWEIIGSTQIDLSDYVQKSQTSGLIKNDGTIDQTQYLSQHQDISGKSDKVANSTNGNLAGLNASGNLTDSGKAPTDFEDVDDVMDSSDLNDIFHELPTARDNYQEYSTTEQVVGRWVDGKTIYQKTYVPSDSYGTGTTTVVSNIVSDLRIECIVNLNAMLYRTDNSYATIVSNTSISNGDYCWINDSGALVFTKSTTSYSGWKLHITIQYTKTTD